MIKIFFAQQVKLANPSRLYKFLYFYHTEYREVKILNPWNRSLKLIPETHIEELYYTDDNIIRIHRLLFDWEE